MGTIRKRGKYWYFDLYVNGRRIRKKVGKSKEIAALALKDAEVKAARNEFGFDQNDIALDKFFTKFLDYSTTNHSANTTKRYRAVIDNFKRFLSTYPDIVKLSQIKPEHIDLYKSFRRDNGNGNQSKFTIAQNDATLKGARAKTVNFEIDTLRTLFNVAIKWEYLKENPTQNITRLKVTDSKPPRFLTEEECEKILEYSPEELRPIFFTFLNTGMRKAELENLEWEDVDLRRKKIKIRRKPFWQPKTGEREIPLNQKMCELLSGLKKANATGLRSNFVFPHSDGTKIKTKLRRQLIKIGKQAGIKDLTAIHALRHTFASQLVMKGVDLPTVQKLMGHTDIKTTMIYAHLAPDHLADAVEKLGFGK